MNEPPSKETPVQTVGYRRPPVEHQFKKGRSGNPNGRPRKSSTPIKAIIKAELEKLISITQNGERTTATYLQAIIKKAVQDAATGTPTERRLMLKLLAEHLPASMTQDLPNEIRVRFVKHDEQL